MAARLWFACASDSEIRALLLGKKGKKIVCRHLVNVGGNNYAHVR